MVRLRRMTRDEIPLITSWYDDEDNLQVSCDGRDVRDPKVWEELYPTTQLIIVNSEAVGNIQYDGDNIGFYVRKPYRNKGIATAAVETFIALIGPDLLYAGCWETNNASRRVLEKAGFEQYRSKHMYAHGENRKALLFERYQNSG